MADKFQDFNRFVETLHHYPMISGQELEQLFRDIDTEIQRGIQALLATTHFVEDNLCYYLADISTGAMKSKLYRGRFVKARQGAGEGVVVGAEDAKIIGTGFDLFKLSRCSREIAPPLVQRIMRSLRLQNMTYEHILRSFIDVTIKYQETCEQLATELSLLQENENTARPEVFVRMQRIGDLIDRKEQIESSAGCARPNTLYGTIAIVRNHVNKIHKVQQEILHAYLRAVPRVVREFAKSDQDAKDKFQAGAVGLMYAISKFDFRSGAGFTRFARTWIRQRIQRYQKETGGPMIRLTPGIWEAAQKIERARRFLVKQADHQNDVTATELAEYLGWEEEKVHRIQEKMTLCHVTPLDSELLIGNEQIEMEATIPDDTADDLRDQDEKQELIRRTIEPLSPDDKRLVLLRTGVLDLVDNSGIRPAEILHEILRQIACKTLLHSTMADRIENVRSVPLTEEENVDGATR